MTLHHMRFDETKKRWIASYPFCESPIVLDDNYRQVEAFTRKLESKLKRTHREEEFNEQFYETVKRGVFRELTDVRWKTRMAQ